MRTRFIFASLVGMGLAATAAATPRERFSLDLEGSVAWQQGNEVQSPNTAAGTRFSLGDLTGAGPYPTARVQLTIPLNDRDDLRLLAAPLRISEQGTLRTAVNFEGKAFSAGAATATYRFDSYRATWRRTVHESADWTVKAGITGKIRSAEITLQQGGTRASRTDIGFVPLAHVHAERRLSDSARFILEGDGLASSRGRAFDLSMRYAQDLRPGVAAFAGVRLLDGGANNDSVYNFARFGYVTVGLTFTGY